MKISLNKLIVGFLISLSVVIFILTISNVYKKTVTMVNENNQLMAPLVEDKSVSLISECDENVSVYADKQMLMTILRNLTMNAIKFTPLEDDILVKISTGDKQGFIDVTIFDISIGLSNEDATKLFDEHIDISKIGPVSGKGTGLGLKVCKGFVVMNGGDIWAESDSKGCKFNFKLRSS
ncbi:MAG: HAMP domain-containing histidine kinase [Bacteriovoracaceae bacterium]|nr:HAMP domain-containing histidine kinase [Bacteriovoracaceae bacterium]